MSSNRAIVRLVLKFLLIASSFLFGLTAGGKACAVGSRNYPVRCDVYSQIFPGDIQTPANLTAPLTCGKVNVTAFISRPTFVAIADKTYTFTVSQFPFNVGPVANGGSTAAPFDDTLLFIQDPTTCAIIACNDNTTDKAYSSKVSVKLAKGQTVTVIVAVRGKQNQNMVVLGGDSSSAYVPPPPRLNIETSVKSTTASFSWFNGGAPLTCLKAYTLEVKATVAPRGDVPGTFRLDFPGPYADLDDAIVPHMYTVQGLAPGTNYTARVATTSAAGTSAFSTPITFTTAAAEVTSERGVPAP